MYFIFIFYFFLAKFFLKHYYSGKPPNLNPAKFNFLLEPSKLISSYFVMFGGRAKPRKFLRITLVRFSYSSKSSKSYEIYILVLWVVSVRIFSKELMEHTSFLEFASHRKCIAHHTPL